MQSSWIVDSVVDTELVVGLLYCGRLDCSLLISDCEPIWYCS